MPNDAPPRPASSRDGTSQSGRVLRDLDPARAPIDERTTRDLLAFAKAYARELKYFEASDPWRPRGDWSAFIGPEIDLDAAAEYAEEAHTGVAVPDAYTRPHFALLLASLRLFRHARAQLNDVTRRHLEFFYGDVLRMARTGAVPDSVHVLVDLDARTDALRLPARTALHAGRDSLGNDLVYLTDRELVASRATVGRISTVNADVRFTGIRDASPYALIGGRRTDAFLAMLRIALGQPSPGDPLPVPIYAGVPTVVAGQPAPDVTFDVLLQVQKLAGVVESQLGMPAFDDFRSLINLRRIRQASEAKDWAFINTFLAKAGKKRDPNFTFTPQNPADFQANLRTVLNKTPDEFAHLYDGLPEVKSIEEAYATYTKRPDVAVFIQTRLFLSLADFKTMMQAKGVMDNQWAEITRLLEQAGQRKRGDAAFRFTDAVRASHNVDEKFTAAVGAPDYTVAGGLDGYNDALRAVEQYFFMPAESVKYMLSVATRPGGPGEDDWDWEQVYDILASAYREKIYARRRDALKNAAQAALAANDRVRALAAMLVNVLGVPAPSDAAVKKFVDDSLQRLGSLGVTGDDLEYLKSIASGALQSPDWSRVYRVLEVAQRNRENFRDPVAEKVEWRNLYPAPDARAVRAQLDVEGAGAAPRWKTFGRGEPPPGVEPGPVFGWAMASPLLALAEGKRTVTLTLGFSPEPERFDRDRIRKLLNPSDAAAVTATFNPFDVELSTAKGWAKPLTVALTWVDQTLTHYPDVPGVDVSRLYALTLTVTMAENQPPVVAPSRAVHGIDAASPVLRLMLRPTWSDADAAYVTNYQLLRNLLLVRAHLTVRVGGLLALTIRNDQTTLDVKKPFEPFGTSPATGSRFYIGHRELAAKRLDSVTFRVTWMGVPPAVGAHYANYSSTALTNADFKARVALVDAGVLKDFSGPMPLFDASDATKPLVQTLTPPADQGNPEQAVTTPADVLEWNRFLVWELSSPGFQHSIYPTVALQKSLEMAAAVVNKTPATIVAATYQVNPPITPKIKSLGVDYVASAELSFEPKAAAVVAARVFHVQPFGYADVQPDPAQPGRLLLPQYDYQGELYVGLGGVVAPQNVSLLFQMAEGSANPDRAPQPVEWSVLSGNRWIPMPDGSLLSDGTRGLINTGIVELSLVPTEPSTLLPPGLYWIRAAIARSADCVCDTLDVYSNAGVATFDDRGNAPDHLSLPLAAGRITATTEPVPGIAAIRQPYTSFGGQVAELDEDFYVRVSERLRHKQRALAPWDYERLVLEAFPDLYKVKCLRADAVARARQPGRIDIVVIPDIRNRLPFDPFEPKAPANLLRDIERFLQDKTPAFAQVAVKNAQYVPVKVRCGVRFMPGQDPSFCRRQLNDELNRFLSPWAYEEGADLSIGGNVYANSIIDFIEQRDYVDYVAQLRLFTIDNEGETTLVPETDDYHVTAQRADAVLVAAREHQFDVITHADYRVEVFNGINYMRIELDFIVA